MVLDSAALIQETADIIAGKELGEMVDMLSAESSLQRLDYANNHFRRKASEIFNDEAALRLLATMYRNIVIEIADFDSCQNGISLAKLTAANFCEIGANTIQITEAGQKFIESIENA